MVSPHDRAQVGLELVKEAIMQELRSNRKGMTNAGIVHSLGLESEFEGENRNYLSWSILGLLIKEGKVRYEGEGKGKTYFIM